VGGSVRQIEKNNVCTKMVIAGRGKPTSNSHGDDKSRELIEPISSGGEWGIEKGKASVRMLPAERGDAEMDFDSRKKGANATAAGIVMDQIGRREGASHFLFLQKKRGPRRGEGGGGLDPDCRRENKKRID